ncbi:MAG: hypothetical protein AB8F74_11060, partial [Saprospiraceae bacterium]
VIPNPTATQNIDKVLNNNSNGSANVNKTDNVSIKDATPAAATNNNLSVGTSQSSSNTFTNNDIPNAGSTISDNENAEEQNILVVNDTEEAEETNNTTIEKDNSATGTATTDDKKSAIAPVAISTSVNQLTINSLLAQIKMAPKMAAFDEDELPAFQEPAIIKIKPHKSPFSLGAYGGYGLAAHHLSSNASEDAGYLSLREKTETAEQILTAGLNLQYQFKKGLYLKTGLGYQQITERFDFTKVTQSDIDVLQTPTTVYKRSDGTIDTTLGTVTVQKINIQDRKIYNRYRMIDLPLLVGYQQATTNRLSWFAEAGVLVNLAFLPDGEIIDEDGETIIDLAKSDDFRNAAGLTVSGAVGLSYRITKRISLQISPRLRYGLGSVTNGNSPLSQQFWSGALETGMRYQF